MMERQTDKESNGQRCERRGGWGGGRKEWDCISCMKSVKAATQDESSE